MSEDLLTAGANYNFYDKSSIYIRLETRSFRYPVLDEIFNFFTNTIDTTLIPQTSDNYEFGIRHYFTRKSICQCKYFSDRHKKRNDL